MEHKLEQNLQLLDFEITVNSSTLLFTNKNYKSQDISFGERLILEEARKLLATAVYFRRTNANQRSLPQIFIYDNTHNILKNTDLVEIHRKLWSSDIVSIYYVIDKTQVRVFDARKPVSYKNNRLFVSPLDTIELVAEAHKTYQNYSAKLFENGSFWEQPQNRNNFLYSHSASQKLIDGLKKFRDDFIKNSDVSQPLAHKLLVQSILVKYLEERQDEHNNDVFEVDFFSQYQNASNFCDVIRNGNLVALFKTLSTHFNGKIFELSDDEKKILTQTDLSSLADFLDANVENNQYVMWRLYAFDYLPVELISRIYEEFIPQRADAVYTPIHLAQFMVDECMPLDIPQQNYKLIDISCGSGVFLVTAFKRLVQWWQKQHYDQTDELVNPDRETLLSILNQSIYGVDIEEDAIRLSIFSLSIALCDMLSPTEIWLNLKFGDLEKENLYHGNFFSYLSQTKKAFDLVIGNPPFKDKNENLKDFIEVYNLKTTCDIPRNQIALLFLQQAMTILKKDGLLSLVMPAGPLLYNQTVEYRCDFFSRYQIPQIVDFSALAPKSYLFERTISTVIIFAEKKTPKQDHNILHITVKRSQVAKNRHFFEIDHYDLHFVPQEIAISNSVIDSIVWKTNLWGGGQLYYLVKRLLNCNSLEEYLKNKKKNKGWFYGEGYNIGNKSKQAPHLTNKLMVKTDKFTEQGILETNIEYEKHFERTREKNCRIFKAPHLLIKETPGNKKFVTTYLETDLIFKHEIIGIHAPWGQEDDLKYIETYLQKNHLLFKVLMLAFSSRAGISRSLSTVLKKDFMALPFPEDEKVLELSQNEAIILQDMVNYRFDEYKKGEKAHINTTEVNEEQLTEFGDVFCQNLNNIYKTDDNCFYPLQPSYGLAYICYPFTYGQIHNVTTKSILADEQLDSLLKNKQNSVTYQRVLRLYQKDIVYFIKPTLLRYWLKSIALYDATDVMIDLVESGY